MSNRLSARIQITAEAIQEGNAGAFSRAIWEEKRQLLMDLQRMEEQFFMGKQWLEHSEWRDPDYWIDDGL